ILPALSLLRSHVRRRAHDRTRLSLPLAVELLGKTEVRDLAGEAFQPDFFPQTSLTLARCSLRVRLESLTCRDQDVGGLQVPVNPSCPVGGLHRQSKSLDQRGGLARLDRSSRQLVIQTAGGAELEAEKGQSVVLPDLEELDNVGMLQSRDCLRLG